MLIITSIIAFTIIILLLVFMLLFAQAKLVQSGPVKITINGDEQNPVVASAGSSLPKSCLLPEREGCSRTKRRAAWSK